MKTTTSMPTSMGHELPGLGLRGIYYPDERESKGNGNGTSRFISIW